MKPPVPDHMQSSHRCARTRFALIAVLLAGLAATAGAEAPRGLDPDRHVRLYSATWCGYCKRARAYLESRHIPYEDLDVETTERGRRQFAQLGGRGVPIILVGRQRMDGYEQAELARMLATAGW